MIRPLFSTICTAVLWASPAPAQNLWDLVSGADGMAGAMATFEAAESTLGGETTTMVDASRAAPVLLGLWQATPTPGVTVRFDLRDTVMFRQVNQGPVQQLLLTRENGRLVLPQTGEAYDIVETAHGITLRDTRNSEADLILTPGEGFVAADAIGELPDTVNMSFAAIDSPRSGPTTPGLPATTEAATAPAATAAAPQQPVAQDPGARTEPGQPDLSAREISPSDMFSALQTAIAPTGPPAEAIVTERQAMAEFAILLAESNIYAGPDRRHDITMTVESIDLVRIVAYGTNTFGEFWAQVTQNAGLNGYVAGDDLRFHVADELRGPCQYTALHEDGGLDWESECFFTAYQGISQGGDVFALFGFRPTDESLSARTIQFANGIYDTGVGIAQRRDNRCLASDDGRIEICHPDLARVAFYPPDPLPLGTYYTTTGLNLRIGPGTRFDPVRVLEPGEEVDVLGAATRIGDTPWHWVRDSAGREGFVSASYLSDVPLAEADTEVPVAASATEAAPATPTPSRANTRFLTNNSNVRDGPGTSFDVVGVADRGSTAQILSERRDADGDIWFEVWIADAALTGFVYSSLLSDTPVDTAAEAAAAQTMPQTPVTQTARAAFDGTVTLLPGLHTNPVAYLGGHIAFCVYPGATAATLDIAYAQHVGRLSTTRERALALVPIEQRASARCRVIADYPCLGVVNTGTRFRYFGAHRAADLAPLLRRSNQYSGPQSARLGCF